MPHTIHRISDVEFELEVEASADDLSGELEAAVRKQRARTALKGFRPGKVPSAIVRKLYGKALAYGVAEDHVQKAYQAQVLDTKEYDVLGQPTITDLEYEYEGDLKAKVRFGVRPQFEVQDLAGATVSKLVHHVDDDEVAEELESMRERAADMTPAEGPTTADSYLVTDIQEVDEESGTPIVGARREGVAFFLGSDELKKETRKALVGLSVGDTARVVLVRTDDESESRFDVTIREIKDRNLPELDDAFAAQVSGGAHETLDALREDLAVRMQAGVDQTSRELFEGALIRRVLEAHTFAVPESVVDMYVDARVKDFRAQAGDRLPPDFDEDAFRHSARPDAERQARWMFVRDRVIEREGIEVNEDDRRAYFEETGKKDGLSADLLMQYYRSMPKLMSQLNDRLLTTRVLDWFAAQATVQEMDREAFRAEAEETRRKQEAEHGHHHHHGHDHDHDHSH